MKNQNFSYSSERYPRVSIEMWCDCFSWNIFLTCQKSKIELSWTCVQTGTHNVADGTKKIKRYCGCIGASPLQVWLLFIAYDWIVRYLLFIRQPFNSSICRVIFGPAIFYSSRSDSLKFSVSLSTWRAAEVFSHSLISNKNCLLWTSYWISRFSFWQCVTKSNQLTITWHIEMKSTLAAIFIFRREQIKRFSLYKQGTDARRLHYFYGLLSKNKG